MKKSAVAAGAAEKREVPRKASLASESEPGWVIILYPVEVFADSGAATDGCRASLLIVP